MQYYKSVELKNGKTCIFRNGTKEDGASLLEVFLQTHEETDFLLTYPDENSFDEEQEGEFLQEKAASGKEAEIVAVVDGRIVGSAGIEAIGNKAKVKHRAEFGVSILREYWGMGIGKKLLEICVELAVKAGYEQLELNVVADNERAVFLYEQAGFVICGRNPRGFKSRQTGYQELITMRLELS